MRHKLTPQEKKRHSLAKDHPLQAEAPKAFRRKWPKSKRIAEKVLRAKIRDHLHVLRGSVNPDAVDATDTTRFKQPVIRKWGCASLAEVIAQKQDRGVCSVGRRRNNQLRRALAQVIRTHLPNMRHFTVYAPQASDGPFFAILHYNLEDDTRYRWARIRVVHDAGASRIATMEPHDGLW
ncbi:MAG: hypothetical protein IPK50_11885 [Fibrobacterota bacterium]|nr:hypothetical protein [Fibrobacterota bacterium]QQS07571.1 MAG: hypothetical protein IPK50_11885 [Fibrobacterota bacterium]